MEYRNLIIKELHSAETQFYLTNKFEKTSKNLELAKQIRQIGTKMYLGCQHSAKIHERIWDSYMCSIAFVPPKSEALAISYGNMSALLFHMYKYEECIKNIDRALNITESPALRVKLLCRKVKCLKALQVSVENSYLAEAEACLMKIDDNHENKQELERMIAKTKIIVEKIKVDR